MREARQEVALDVVGVCHAAADAAVVPAVRLGPGPGVMLILEILDGLKGPKRQKARLEIADRALVLALRLRASLL
jgi:hypothetical protein